MNHMIQVLKKSISLSLLTVFCLCHHVKAVNVAEYFYTKGDVFVRLASGEVYVAAHKKGRLGCTLSRLPLIKKDEAEAPEEALMHKIVTINHESKKENPLFNESIVFFTMFDSGHRLLPLMVSEHAPAELYLMERYAPCTVQGDVIVKEKKEAAKPEEKKAKKSSHDKSSHDKSPQSKSSKNKQDTDKKVEEKKEEPAPCELLSSGILKDAAGKDVGEIVAVEQINSSMIAVAVAPQNGAFGSPGSGIALVKIVEEAEKKDEQVPKDPKNKDAKQETPKMVRVLRQVSVEGLAGKDMVRAYPLDCTTPAVTLGGVSAASFGQKVSLHWDKRLERLFIGLDVTSADNEQASVAAVVVARIEHDEEEQKIVEQPKKQKDSEASKRSKTGETAEKEKEEEPKTKRILHAKLLFEPILSKVKLEQSLDYIIAQKGAQNHIVADELKTLWTGTQTPHLIVLRRDLHKKDQVALFALPLVSGKSFELGKQRKKVMSDLNKIEKITAKEGTSEHKKQVARNKAVQKALEAESLALHRSIQEHDVTRGTLASVEQGVEELFFDYHPYTLEERRLPLEATVAKNLFTQQSEAACVGGGALNGCIGDITVRGDAAEVTVYTMENTKEVYLSRPLLNSAGMIDRWTLWRPLATVKNALPVEDAQTQRSYFEGQHDVCAVTIEQKDGVEVHRRVKNADASEEPMHQFASHVNDLCKNQTMLGAREVVISQPYAEQEVVACAYSTKQLVISTLDRHQGVQAVAFSFPCDMKSIRGIAVAGLESKTLFVGGYNGLYALVDERGNGWPLDKKMSDLSVDERASFSFVRIGQGYRIRSLVCDRQFLYVLTNKTFERVDLLASTFSRDGEIVSTTLALSDALPDHGKRDMFLDCVVSDKLALLATTRGFFRIADNLDVRDVAYAATCSWVRINVPCQEGPIVQLVPLSVTGLATDCARCGGGELYVLNSYAGYNTTRVTRYHVADCSCSEVSDATVKLLPDHFMKNEETTFIRLNDYTTSLAIDGGSCLLVHPGSEVKKSCLYQKEFPAEKSHAGATRFARTPIKFELAENELIVSVALSVATGKMLVTTTQGLRILD